MSDHGQGAAGSRRQAASPKPLRVLITGYIFCTAVVIALVAACITQVSMWILFTPLFVVHPRLKSILLGRALRFWCAVGGFIINPFWRIKIVRQPPNGYRPSKTLLMMNHLSSADPWIAARALFPSWELKFVYKADLLKIPVAGWAVWLSGDLPIYFTKEKGGWGTRPGSVSAMMESVKKLHAEDIGLVVFPEGTRSKTGRLQPFKDGFFRFALETDCEILPCVIHNAQALWPLGSSLFDMGTVYFAFGDPMRPKEGESIDELKSRVKEAMVELLKECPLYDAVAEAPITHMASSRGLGISGASKKRHSTSSSCDLPASKELLHKEDNALEEDHSSPEGKKDQ